MNQESVCRQIVTVKNENGLHLIPGSLIAQLARRYDCEIRILNGEVTADARNVLDLIALNAVCGTTLEIEATGDGAVEALEGVVELFESSFELPEPEA